MIHITNIMTVYKITIVCGLNNSRICWPVNIYNIQARFKLIAIIVALYKHYKVNGLTFHIKYIFTKK